MMNGLGLIGTLVVGALAGWLASKIMNNQGSLVRNVILGVVGGIVGRLVLGIVAISGSGFFGNLIVSAIGACIVIWLVNSITKK